MVVINPTKRKIWSGVVLLGVALLVVYWKGDLPSNFSTFLLSTL